MNIKKLMKQANITRVGGNAHRFICRVNGKLRSFTTHEKDFDTNLASLFSNLNAFFAPSLKSAVAASLLASMALSGAVSWADNLPTNGSFQGGSNGTINTTGNNMTVNVTHEVNGSSAINWKSFDVASGYQFYLNQLSNSSSSLNRVTGASLSTINGLLQSNGKVFLINPNGIVFGSGAQVNVASLFASTLNITPNSFLNGSRTFSRGLLTAPKAVINNANITVPEGGFIVMSGGAIVNAGNLYAPGGNVSLKVGDQVTMVPDASVGVRITVDKTLKQKVAGYNEAIKNLGTISAAGGLVSLQASLANNIYATAVNNSGTIQATSVAIKNGTVEFRADGSNAAIVNTGNIDVSGQASSPNAGTITFNGDGNVNVQGDLLASAAAGGAVGNINVTSGSDVNFTGTTNTGGGHLTVNAASNKSVLGSISGTINTNGVINTGGGNVTMNAGANTTATGIVGNVTGTINVNNDINSNGGNVALNAGTNSQATGIAGNVTGNITTSGNINTNGGNVTAKAGVGSTGSGLIVGAENGNITVNKDINTGTGNVDLNATNAITVNAPITTTGGHINMTTLKNIKINGVLNAGLGSIALTANGEHKPLLSNWQSDGVIDVLKNVTAGNITLDTQSAHTAYGDVNVGTGVQVHATGLGNTDLVFDDNNATSAPALPTGPSTIDGSYAAGNAGKVIIKGELNNKGTITADGAGIKDITVNYKNDVNLNQLTLDATGSTAAKGSISITGSSGAHHGTLVEKMGTSSPGNISVSSTDGQIKGSDVVMKSGLGDITLSAGKAIDLTGKFNSGRITATAGTSFNLNDTASAVVLKNILAGGNLSVTSVDNITVLNGGSVESTNGNVKFTGVNITNNGVLKGQTGVDLTASQNITNYELHSGNGSDVNLTAGGDITNKHWIESGRDLNITATGDLSNNGTASSSGNLKATATNITNTGEFIGGNQLDISAAGSLNTSGRIASNSSLKVTSNGDLTNTNDIHSNGSDVTLTSTNGSVINSGSVESKLSTLNVSAQNNVTNDGSLKSNGNLTVTATTGGISNNTTGQIASTVGNVTLNSQTDLINAGTVTANAGHITANSTLGHIINNGTFDANQNLALTVTGSNDIKGIGVFKANKLILSLENGDATQDGSFWGGALSTVTNNFQANNAAGSTGAVRVLNTGALNILESNVHNGLLSAQASGGDLVQTADVTGNTVEFMAHGGGNIHQTGGTLHAQNANLISSTSIYGAAPGQGFKLDVDNLSSEAWGGSATFAELNALTLKNNYATQNFSLTSGGAQTIAGNVHTQSGNVNLTATTGDIIVNAGGNVQSEGTSGDINLLASSGGILNNGTVQAGRHANLTANNGDIINNNLLSAAQTMTLKVLNAGDIKGAGVFKADKLVLNLAQGDATQDGSFGGGRLNTNINQLQANNANNTAGAVRIDNVSAVTIQDSNLHNGDLDVHAGSLGNTGNIHQAGNVAAKNVTLEARYDGNITQAQGKLLTVAERTNLIASGNIYGYNPNAAFNISTKDLWAQAWQGSARIQEANGVNLVADSYARDNFNLTASKGDINVIDTVKTNNGQLNLKASLGNINVQGSTQSVNGETNLDAARSINVNGSVQAGTNTNLGASIGDINVNGSVQAGNQANLNVGLGNINVPGTVVSGSSSTLSSKLGNVAVSGSINAGTDAKLNTDAGNVDVSGSVTSGSGSMLSTKLGNVTVGGNVNAGSTASLYSAAGTINVPGSINAGTGASLSTGIGSVNVTGTVNSVTGPVDLTTGYGDINVDGLVNTDNGKITATAGNTTLFGASIGTGNINVGTTGKITAHGIDSGVSLKANRTLGNGGDITNNGTVSSENNELKLDAEHNIQNNGILKATNGTINANADAKFTNTNAVDAYGNITVTSGTGLTNSSVAHITSHHGSVSLDNASGLLSNEGKLLAKGSTGNVTLNSGSIDNSGLIKSKHGSVSAQSDNDIANSGRINGKTDVSLTATTGNITNSSRITAETGNVSATAGASISNSGRIRANAGNVNLNASDDITNDGRIFGAQNVSLTAVDQILNNFRIRALNDIQLNGKDITNAAGAHIVGGNNVSLVASNDILNNGTILGTHITGTAIHDITNNALINAGNKSGIDPNHTVNLTAGNNLNVTSGAQVLGDQLNLTTTNGNVTVGGQVGDDLTLLATVDAGNNFTVQSKGTVLGSQINGKAKNDINVNAGALIGNANTVLNTLNAGHDVNVESTETGDCCDPNSATAAQAGRVFGNTVNVTAGHNVVVNGYVGDGHADSVVNVTANNNISGSGLFSGHSVNLRSNSGDIGSVAQRIRTAANLLALNAPNGSVYGLQLGSTALQDSTALNNFWLTVARACGAPASAIANLTIQGNVHGGNLNLNTQNGNIISQGLASGNNVTLIANGGSILDGNGDALNLLATGDSTLIADGIIGTLQNPFDVNVQGGNLFIGVNGSIRGVSAAINGIVNPSNTLRPLNNPPGAVFFNGQFLFGNGPIRIAIDKGLPYLMQDYRNQTNPLFSTAANTSGKLLRNSALQNVSAEIINNWQQPEPFDLRLIQLDDQEGSEAYELLMTTSH